MLQSLLPGLHLRQLPEIESPVVSRLISAAALGDLPAVESTLSEWKATNSSNASGIEGARRSLGEADYALAVAAYHNQVDVVSYLLSEGFRPGSIATRYAMGGRSMSALEVFQREGGWDINREIHAGPPGLADAAGASDWELTSWFLAHGASPNAYALYQPYTPLSRAVSCGSPEIVDLLMAYGGNARIGSLLQMAARREGPGKLAILEPLLEKGAAINGLEMEDCPRKFNTWKVRGLGTALHVAVLSKHRAMVGALIGKGARKDIQDTKGRTPLDLAREYDLPDMIELLEEI